MTTTSERRVLPRWPGETMRVGRQGVHVRRARPDATPAHGMAGASAPASAVLVHGLGGSATNWTDLMGLLRDELDLVAPDLPGFGWSPPPVDGDYSLRAHAGVVADLVETMGSGPVHLLGSSLGGTVATLVAADRPELVRTLTLVSPALPVLRPRASNVHLPALAAPWIGQRLARRLGRFPVEQRVRATIALCFADPSCVPPERVEEAVAEAARRARLEHDGDAVLSSLRALLSSYLQRGAKSLWRVAERVEAPTLLVYGQRDRLVDPRTALRAARAFPDARLLVIPNSGHLSQVEHPERVAAAVRRHITASERRSPAERS